MKDRLIALKARLAISPERYALFARVALVMLTLIVLTGAAVRVTGSGLGCPTWPRCTDTSLYTKLTTHGVIEFGNRLLTFFVGFAAIGAFAAAFLRSAAAPRPRLALAAAAARRRLPGRARRLHRALRPRAGLRHEPLPPVDAHPRGLRRAGLARASRARRRRRDAPGRSPDRARRSGASSRSARCTIFAGTAATAAGPHAGGAGTGDVIKRLDFKGAETLRFVIEQHARLATLLGLAAVGLWLLARRRGGPPEQRRALTVLCLLLAAQGVVGGVQYALELPAEIVWVHVGLAASTWLSILWVFAASGTRAAAGAAAVRGAGAAATAR